MKNKSSFIYTAVLSLIYFACVNPTSAQTRETTEVKQGGLIKEITLVQKEGLPNTLTWNILGREKERLENPDAAPSIVIKKEWNIWNRPNTNRMSVDLYYIESEVSDKISPEVFIKEMQAQGYSLCPPWVAFNLWLMTTNFTGNIWIPFEECFVGSRLSEIPRFGRTGSNSFTSSKYSEDPDLASADPRSSKRTDLWVFTKNHENEH